MWTCTLRGLNKPGPNTEESKLTVIHFVLKNSKEKIHAMQYLFKNYILFNCVTLGSILFPHYGSTVKTAIFVLLDVCHKG
jgi:hypothetical protein